MDKNKSGILEGRYFSKAEYDYGKKSHLSCFYRGKFLPLKEKQAHQFYSGGRFSLRQVEQPSHTHTHKHTHPHTLTPLHTEILTYTLTRTYSVPLLLK